MSQFTNKIIHISGKLNIVADALSGPHVEVISMKIMTKNIAGAQKDNNKIKELRENGYHGQVFNDLLTKDGNKFCAVNSVV